MFGFMIAGFSALGLVFLAKRHRRHSPLSWALRRLDATPAQEKVIREATGEFRGAFRELKEEGRASKAELADVLRSERFDRERIGSWIAARRASLDALSPRLLSAAEEIHNTLDSEQRVKLSKWLERGAFHHRRHAC